MPELKMHDGLAKLAEITLEGGPRCAICKGPAVCFGAYEDATKRELACDECCGHGCEDGACTPLECTEERRLASGILKRTAERDHAQARLKRAHEALIYARDRRGTRFDFDTWAELVRLALE